MHSPLIATLKRLNDPTFLYASTSFREAIARMHFAVQHRQQLAVLVGEKCSGRTTMLQRFRKELRSTPAQVVQLSLAQRSQSDLLDGLADQLGLRLHRSWRRIVERLVECSYEQSPLVLLIDNAEHVSSDAFDFLARVRHADSTGQLQVTMILATEEFSLAQWPDVWLHRVDLRLQLDLWSRDDVRMFLAELVGDDRRKHIGFSDDAVQRIYELTAGSPPRVCRLARLALLATESLERAIVDGETVYGASQELLSYSQAAVYDSSSSIEICDTLDQPVDA